MNSIMLKAYYSMHRHYTTFLFLKFFEKVGISLGLSELSRLVRDKQLRAVPTTRMKESAAFFTRNQDRIRNMLSLLADEESRRAWKAAVRYRVERMPIAPELRSEDDPYFVKDLFQISDGEVFIDGGAYTGDTIKQFLSIARKQKIQYKQIIAFEPEENNFRWLAKSFGGKEKIVLIKKGLSIQEEMLYFTGGGTVARIVEGNRNGSYQVPVINIDAIAACREATWIKMDIEGSEMKALQGACETIKKNRPKLAICIYHSNEDMIRIIEYIHSLVPEYQLHVRHHSKDAVDTVLYAHV